MQLRCPCPGEKSGPGAMLTPASRARAWSSSASTASGISTHRKQPPRGCDMRVPAGKASATAAAVRSMMRASCSRRPRRWRS